MARETDINVFKRDTLMLDFLKTRKGKQNIVSAKEIAEFLNSKGGSVKPKAVNNFVKRIMYNRNAPICHSNAKGYYWASNRAEIKEAISDMEKRITALQKHLNHLNNFIID